MPIGVRTGGGGRGGLQSPQLQKFFGQNADDSGKSTVDNTLLDLNNSSYPTHPHSIIAKKLQIIFWNSR